VHALHDLAHQRLAGGGVGGRVAQLGDHVEPLGAGALVVHADRGGIAHARHVVDDLLDVSGHDVLAAEDDDVLEPAGDVEVALGVDEAEVARTQPAVGGEDLGRRLRLLW